MFEDACEDDPASIAFDKVSDHGAYDYSLSMALSDIMTVPAENCDPSSPFIGD